MLNKRPTLELDQSGKYLSDVGPKYMCEMNEDDQHFFGFPIIKRNYHAIILQIGENGRNFYNMLSTYLKDKDNNDELFLAFYHNTWYPIGIGSEYKNATLDLKRRSLDVKIYDNKFPDLLKVIEDNLLFLDDAGEVQLNRKYLKYLLKVDYQDNYVDGKIS